MSASPVTEHRRTLERQPKIGGISVREEDIEPVKGIRAIAILFRGMSLLLLVLMVLQVFFGLTSTVPMSVGVMFAEALRLVVFAGLLWGGGDLAVLWVKSHHDIRATRILTARIASMIQHIGEANGSLRSNGGASLDNET